MAGTENAGHAVSKRGGGGIPSLPDVRLYPDNLLFCAYTLAVNQLRYALISFLAEPAHPAVECTWADAFLPAPLVVCQATGATFHDQTALLFRFDWLCWHILNLRFFGLFERDVSADEHDQPAVLLIKVLNKL